MELDGFASTVMPLPTVTLTSDLLTYSVCSRLRYIHGLIVVKSPPIVTKILYSPNFQVIACCGLDLLTSKANQHIYEPKYICDQNWMKFPSLVFEIWCSHAIRATACCDLHLLTPKANQHIYEPIDICDQNLVKFPSLVFVIWCWQGFQHAQTHELTHRQTDPNTVCPLHCFSTVAET